MSSDRYMNRVNHLRYVGENRGLFWLLDIFMVLIIVANLCAFGITQYVAVKEKVSHAPVEVLESNPVTAQMHGFKTNWLVVSQFLQTYKGLFVKYVVLLGLYILFRRTVRTDEQMNVLLMVITSLFVVVLFDLVNNFAILKAIGGI